MAGTGIRPYTGFWIDHSKGTVLGGTLTYGTTAGSQMITAAALLVQFIGAAVWVLVAFWLHQRASTGDLHDEFEAQKRVILRNTGSPTSALLAFFNLGSTWHGHTSAAWRRALSVMLWPFVIFAGFVAAGVFVGQIANNGQVLLQQGTCGIWAGDYINHYTKSLQLVGNISQVADAYARDCYAKSTTDAVTCSTYAKARLNYTVNYNAPCPIGPDQCTRGYQSVVNFQALGLDSHHDFGINAVPSDRIQLSYNVTCAPVNFTLQQAFTTQDNMTGLRDNNRSYPTYNLTFVNLNTTGGSFDPPFTYNSVIEQYGYQVARYSVDSWKFLQPLNDISTNGILESPFNTSTADLNVHVITANAIRYSLQNSDPIFGTKNSTKGPYYPARQIAMLTCAENYQFCRGKDRCSNWLPLKSWTEWYQSDEAKTVIANAAQNATFQRLVLAMAYVNIFTASTIPSPLKASDYLTPRPYAISAQLPNHQWEIEVEGWYQTVLSGWQYMVQTFVSVPDYVVEQAKFYNLTIVRPESNLSSADAALLAQCTQQRVQAPAGYTSYNVFALAFIFVIALIVIPISVWVSEFNHTLPRRKPGQKNHSKLVAYQADGVLQLHRMALEAAGFGGWRSGHGSREVPYTETGRQRLSHPVSGRRDVKGYGENNDREDPNDEEILYYENNYENAIPAEETHFLGGKNTMNEHDDGPDIVR